MIKNFTFNQYEFDVFSESGEVLDTSKRSSTKVSSSEYGLPDAHGNRRTSIGSTTTETLEFWLRLDDGREQEVSLTNSEVSVRVGQKITMFWVSRTKPVSGYWPGALVNHSSKTSQLLLSESDSIVLMHTGKFRMVRHFSYLLGIPFFMWLILPATSTMMVPLLSGAGYFIFASVNRVLRVKKFGLEFGRFLKDALNSPQASSMASH